MPARWSRRSKYRAKKTKVDGITFDSKKEAARYEDLKRMQQAHMISDLRIHVPFELHVAGIKIGKIIPDFMYMSGGVEIIEDVKSEATITPLFRWKKKHFEAEYKRKIEIYL